MVQELLAYGETEQTWVYKGQANRILTSRIKTTVKDNETAILG